MNHRPVRAFAFALASLFFLACAGGLRAAGGAQPTTPVTVAAAGSEAPTFGAKTLDGKPVVRSSFGGKVLVLNFWATWCPPCRAETPDLVRAYKKLHAADVAFLGIDTTETAPVVKAFLSSQGVPYTTALAGPEVYNNFGIAFIPTTVVVDPRGIVRARWVGGISPEQLRSYIDSARAGKNAAFVSAEQKKIDALLDPTQFSLRGEPDAITKAGAAAQARVAEVDAYTRKLDASNRPRYDDERTSHEEGALLVATSQALLGVAKTTDEKVRADALRATAYGDLNAWSDAAAADRAALVLKPNDFKLTAALERAYYRLHDYGAMAAVTREWIARAPSDPEAYEELGLAEQRAHHFAAAVAPYEKSRALLRARAKKQPIGKTGETVASVADESLDLADVYVSLGNASAARRTFDQAIRYGALIPPKSTYAGLTVRTQERAIEGMTALALANHRMTVLSLSKWTGADLPGSVKSTYKYRLIVVAARNKRVTLSASGLRPGWVASFCADGLCSPKTVDFVMPPAGVKTYEFQLVPPTEGAAPNKIVVSAGDGVTASTP